MTEVHLFTDLIFLIAMRSRSQPSHCNKVKIDGKKKSAQIILICFIILGFNYCFGKGCVLDNLILKHHVACCHLGTCIHIGVSNNPVAFSNLGSYMTQPQSLLTFKKEISCDFDAIVVKVTPWYISTKALSTKQLDSLSPLLIIASHFIRLGREHHASKMVCFKTESYWLASNSSS